VTEHPTPTPQGARNGVRGSTDDVTRVAQDLTQIVALSETLEEQARHKSSDPLMPGGLATVALAPVASLEAWEHQYETLEAMGRGEHVADEDDTWEPPLATLLFWSEQFRVIHNRESDRRPTITTEAGFIRGCLNWAVDHEPHFNHFADEIHRARTRLEDLVYAGRRDQRGVQCFDCQVDLVRKSEDRVILTRCEGHQGVCTWPHRLCGHDRGGLRDEWVCPACDRRYGVEDYQRAVQWAHFIHAEYLPLEKCLERTGASRGSVTAWATRGHVRKRKDPGSGRVVYNVADVETRLASGEVAS
jgi:hypothetical protein